MHGLAKLSLLLSLLLTPFSAYSAESELRNQCALLMVEAEALPREEYDLGAQFDYQDWLDKASVLHRLVWYGEGEPEEGTISWGESPLIRLMTQGERERWLFVSRIFIHTRLAFSHLDNRDFNPLIRFYIQNQEWDLALRLAMSEPRAEVPLDEDLVASLLGYVRERMEPWQTPNGAITLVNDMNAAGITPTASLAYLRDHMDEWRARFRDYELGFVALYGDASDLRRLESLRRRAGESHTENGCRQAIEIITKRRAGIPVYQSIPGRSIGMLDSVLFPYLLPRKED